jgi:hypothetical protein
MALSPLDLGRFFNFLTPHLLLAVSRTPWTGDQPVARALPSHNKRTETSMPRVGFEPTTLVFERAKTVDALDRAATVTAPFYLYRIQICNLNLEQF